MKNMGPKISCRVKKCKERKCAYCVDDKCVKEEIELVISGECFDNSVKCGSFKENLFVEIEQKNKKTACAFGHLDAHGFFRGE